MPAIAPELAPITAAALPRATRVAFVTNFAPHYRIGMFEALAKMCDLKCFFYSDGGEWYWQRAHGVNQGDFCHNYLRGFWLGRMRIAPRLISVLLFGDHDVFIKCINDRFALPITYLIARLRRRPFVLWTGIWCRLTTPVHRLLFPLTRSLYRHADAVVVYGEHVRRYLVSEGVEEERIFVAPQAIDNALYTQTPHQNLEDLGIPPGKKVLLYVGRLEPIKGLEFLLDGFALSANQDCVLVLCGTGSREPALRKRVQQLGISHRVIFAGYVPAAQTIRYYSIAWAALLPSITMPAGRETWGLVANEAFNQGVPLIASDAVGAVAGGLVRHLHNGLVVEEQNPQALAEALDRITTDAALRQALSENARRDVLQWTQTSMAAGFRDAIQFALRKKAGAV